MIVTRILRNKTMIWNKPDWQNIRIQDDKTSTQIKKVI